MDSPAFNGKLNSSHVFNNFSLSKVTFRTKKARLMDFPEIKEDNDGEESSQCFSPPKHSSSVKQSLKSINLKKQFQTPCKKKLDFSTFDGSTKRQKNKKVTLQNEVKFLENQSDDEMIELLPSIKKQGDLKKNHLLLRDSYTFTPDIEGMVKHGRKQDLTNEEQVYLNMKEIEAFEENNPFSHTGSLHSVMCKSKQSKMGNPNEFKQKSSADKLMNDFNKSVNTLEFSEQFQKQKIKNDKYNLDIRFSNFGSKNVKSSSKKYKKKSKKRNSIDEIENSILKKYLKNMKNGNDLKTSPIKDKTGQPPGTDLKLKRKRLPNQIDVMRKLLLSNAIKEMSSSSPNLSSEAVTTKEANGINNIDKKEGRILKKSFKKVNKDEHLNRIPVNDNVEKYNEIKLKVKRNNEPNDSDVENQMKLIKRPLFSNDLKTISPASHIQVVVRKKASKNNIHKVQNSILKECKIKQQDNLISGSVSVNSINSHENKLKIKRKKIPNEVDVIRKQLLLNALKTYSS